MYVFSIAFPTHPIIRHRHFTIHTHTHRQTHLGIRTQSHKRYLFTKTTTFCSKNKVEQKKSDVANLFGIIVRNDMSATHEYVRNTQTELKHESSMEIWIEGAWVCLCASALNSVNCNDGKQKKQMYFEKGNGKLFFSFL